MATTAEDLRRWLQRLMTDSSVTHMIVVCDRFDHRDFPVYVCEGENVHERVSHYADGPMSTIMEVYSAQLPLESQLAERRAYHLD